MVFFFFLFNVNHLNYKMKVVHFHFYINNFIEITIKKIFKNISIKIIMIILKTGVFLFLEIFELFKIHNGDHAQAYCSKIL